MILGARECRDHQLSRAPTSIRNLQLVFAGDGFEKENHSDKWRKFIGFDSDHAKKSTCKV